MTGTDSPHEDLELTAEEAQKLVLDEVRKISSKVAVAFSGGEFLMREDALELLEYNTCLGQWSFINTCGSLLTGEMISDIKQATKGRIILVFSIDSLKTDGSGVTREGSVAFLEEKTQLCRDADIPYFFIVTISKNNLDELEDVFEYVTRDNIPVLRSPFVPRGRGAEYRHLMFDREDMQKTIHPVLRSHFLSYISFVPFIAAPKMFGKHWLKSRIAIKQLGCQAGRGYAGISAEGDVAPCVHLLDSQAVCGNIRKTPLSEIVRDHAVFKGLRSRKPLMGKCGTCRYKQTCGGCRALAFHTNGDVFAEDPTCFIDALSKEERAEYEEIQNRNLAEFANFITTQSPWRDIF
jgi:radical SAM protein with 4Fe4S-binding SPASM domain